MKSTHYFRTIACSTALLACLALPVLAQPKPAKTETKPKPATEAAKDGDPWSRKLPSVGFDNLPLNEVAAYLSDQFPEINFIVHSAVRDVPVSLKLRSVTLDDIFTALDISTKNATEVNVNPATGVPLGGPPGVDPATGLSVPVLPTAISLDIKKVNDRMVSFTPAQSTGQRESKLVTRAFGLSRYLAGKNDKEIDVAMHDIEEALMTCWDMIHNADPEAARNSRAQTQLKLHRATKLLLVVGQPHQVEVVEQVISQLEDESARSQGDALFKTTPQPGGQSVPGISPSTGAPTRGR